VARRELSKLLRGSAVLIIPPFDQERQASGIDPREWVERARARGDASGTVAAVIARMSCRQAMHERADRR
jgi:hypothetical protein